MCAGCGRALVRDEEGLSRKLLGRGATELFCLSCLSRQFQTDEGALRDLIERFREAGCTLFT